jgi:hypothetical protein
MAIPELLTEAEIKDIYEDGNCQEALVVYGWGRIVTTLVAYNVLRKKIETLKAVTEIINPDHKEHSDDQQA